VNQGRNSEEAMVDADQVAEEAMVAGDQVADVIVKVRNFCWLDTTRVVS